MRGAAALMAAAMVGGAMGEGTAVVSSFHYIPGMPLVDYEKGDPVRVGVNSMHSHEALVSYDYYSLPFCKPEHLEDTNGPEENYGEILWGDRRQASLYELKMNVQETCKVVPCRKQTDSFASAEALKLFKTRINNGYRGNFVTDNLPVVSPPEGQWLAGKVNERECADSAPRGWPLGVNERCTGGKTLIHNHLRFNVKINEHTSGHFIIVGVRVVPFSIDWAALGLTPTNTDVCKQMNIGNVTKLMDTPLTTDLPAGAKGKQIYWTYDVNWVNAPDIDWSSRWDEYLSLAWYNKSDQTHWVAIINSLLIVLCLSGFVAMILLRTLRMDFNRYNNPDAADEQAEEMGWKLVHGDVFRRPSWPGMFAVLIGTGLQLIGMVCLSIFIALLGFLSPAHRGALVTTGVLLFILMSIVNGMSTGYILNVFQHRQWKLVFTSGLLYPGLLFGIWTIMELYIMSSRTGANTAPVVAVLEIMGLWFGVSLPLVVLGAGMGFRAPALAPVTSVTSLPRKIPPQRWYLELPVLAVVPGLIPFGAAFVELRFILVSMWQGRVYYVFGFLAISLLTVVIAAAEVAVVVVYFLLVFEEHRWWWRSVLVPGGMGFWFFLYSIYYYKTFLNLRTTLAAFIYFEMMSVIALSLFICAGTIGFLASYAFVRVIYGQIRVE